MPKNLEFPQKREVDMKRMHESNACTNQTHARMQTSLWDCGRQRIDLSIHTATFFRVGDTGNGRSRERRNRPDPRDSKPTNQLKNEQREIGPTKGP